MPIKHLTVKWETETERFSTDDDDDDDHDDDDDAVFSGKEEISDNTITLRFDIILICFSHF